MTHSVLYLHRVKCEKVQTFMKFEAVFGENNESNAVRVIRSIIIFTNSNLSGVLPLRLAPSASEAKDLFSVL